MEEELYYVGVNNPVEVRRTILESSKELVEALKRYEKFKEIRKEKDQEIVQLRASIKEINKIIGKLKSVLPKSRIKISEVIKKDASKVTSKRRSKKKQVVSVQGEVSAIPQKKVAEIDKLEAELNDIESKLGALS